jgi:putative oxidoreductase
MDSHPGLLQKAYGIFERAADLLQSPFLLVIRLYWGWQLAQSGWGKLTHIANVVEYFVSLNLPMPAVFARAVASLELLGGILLFLGLFSRPISLVLTGNMLGAYITADSEAWHSFLTDEPGKFFAADPFPYLLVSLLVLVFGAGKLSLDEVIATVLKKRAAART